jgi:DNA-binding FadR family transcriptional regulator
MPMPNKTKRVQKPLSLKRTKAALTVFDAAADAWEAKFKFNDTATEVMEAARESLAVAFASEVADRNDAAQVREFALSLAGMTMIRRLCGVVKG